MNDSFPREVVSARVLGICSLLAQIYLEYSNRVAKNDAFPKPLKKRDKITANAQRVLVLQMVGKTNGYEQVLGH